MPDPAAERLIADRYALAVPIGQGGMGVVWRARDTLLGREVAIKEVRLPPTIPDSERASIRARVLREARAAARLNHPAAVTLYDVINEQGHAFIVMELINAPTLAQVVAKEGPLDPPRVARIGMQVAAALAAAHQAGIVHRDVKPANVMVGADGARLTDFGIARVKGDPKLTSTGLIVGSPAYMAPEQASGAAAGPEADLWGLGATLYYAVEGRPPFERDGQIAVLTAVVNDDPRAAERAGELGPVIAALLSKDPKRRPAAADLRSQLERVAASAAPTGPTASAGPAAVSRGPAAGGAPTAVLGEPAAAGEPTAGAEPAGDGGPTAVSAGPAAGGGPAAGAEPAAGVEPADGGGSREGAEPRGDPDQAAAASPGDTEQLPELDDDPPAGPPPPPGKPFEMTRPGPTRPGHQGPAHVRPDQPARPTRAATGPPRGHPSALSPPPGAAGNTDPAGPAQAAEAEAHPGIERPAAGGHPAGATPPGATGQPGAAERPGATGQPGAAERPGATGQPGAAGPPPATLPPATLPTAGLPTAGLPTGAAVPGRRLTSGRLPLVIALLAVVALLAAAIATSGVFRAERRGTGSAASAGSRATATTGPAGAATPASRAPSPSPTAGAGQAPSGARVPPGWTSLRHPAGAYTLAYPPGWRASARSDSLNTTSVSGPGGRLFKVQSSSRPGDPMRAWTDLERNFSKRPGYQRIRLEPGRYKGLDAAVWEFTQIEGGQQLHKLDITFKSADERWGYAVLLQAPEQAWSSTANLSGQFEQAFAPSG